MGSLSLASLDTLFSVYLKYDLSRSFKRRSFFLRGPRPQDLFFNLLFSPKLQEVTR